LLILPPLALLGFIFCLVYERTGSLLVPIGMHAFNNTVAYAAQADDGWKVSVAVGPLMFVALILVARALPPAPRLSSA
jgi:membrane protease YdiL (CAAX protease family)